MREVQAPRVTWDKEPKGKEREGLRHYGMVIDHFLEIGVGSVGGRVVQLGDQVCMVHRTEVANNYCLVGLA